MGGRKRRDCGNHYHPACGSILKLNIKRGLEVYGRQEKMGPWEPLSSCMWFHIETEHQKGA